MSYNVIHTYTHTHTRTDGVCRCCIVWFQVTCDHARRIHFVSVGRPGAENDKKLCKLDQYVMDIHTGKRYRDVEFTLYTENGETTKCRGCYLLSDNGYPCGVLLCLVYCVMCASRQLSYNEINPCVLASGTTAGAYFRLQVKLQ